MRSIGFGRSTHRHIGASRTNGAPESRARCRHATSVLLSTSTVCVCSSRSEPKFEGHRGPTGGRAEDVAQAVAGHCEQPPFGIVGDARGRPRRERALERIREHVLGKGDVTRSRGEQRDESAIARPSTLRRRNVSPSGGIRPMGMPLHARATNVMTHNT